MNLRKALFLSPLAVCLASCAAGGSNASSGDGSGSGGGSGTNTDGTGATSPIDIGLGPGQVDPNDTRDVPIRTQQCDQNGQNCGPCLRLALLGTLESAANNKDTQPFVDWLNGNSGGSATVTMVPSKPALDETFLGQYDILVVANVNNWTFSDAEKAAVSAWSHNGGGIISLTGFTSEAPEPGYTSQLLEFSGIGYNSTQTAPSGPSQATPVYYGGGTTSLKDCLTGDANFTTAVPIAPQTGNLTKLTHALSYVGAYIGWGITAPADATVVATDPTSSQPMVVAKEVDVAGRVLAFGDEWIIFASQWESSSPPPNQTQDQYNICWSMPTAEAEGFFHSVATLYQTKQFWYNAINWVAPPNECNFTIVDVDVQVF